MDQCFKQDFVLSNNALAENNEFFKKKEVLGVFIRALTAMLKIKEKKFLLKI